MSMVATQYNSQGAMKQLADLSDQMQDNQTQLRKLRDARTKQQ